MTILKAPENNSWLSQLTEKQLEFICYSTMYTKPKQIDWMKPTQEYRPDRSQPKPIVFTWETDTPHSRLLLSVHKELQDAQVFETDQCTLEVENLLLGQTYYWQVNDSEIFSFRTSEIPPRLLHVDGASNFRDLGGWFTKDKTHRVRQGMIFRGSEIDREITITPEGIRVLHDDLKIKTDLDLRGEATSTSSPIGSDVVLRRISIDCYTPDFEKEHIKPAFRKIFSVLADESNYPIYFHCAGGADRTGTLALLLETVLGLNDHDRILEYHFTNLSIFGARDYLELFGESLAILKTYAPEGSVDDQIIAFLHSCGITEEELQKIRKILLESV